ncbi:MAG: hypothetical protein ACK4WH_10340 [Phycisphaerales bacterium]
MDDLRTTGPQRPWIRRLRFRAFAFVAAICLTSAAVIAFAGAPLWPVVGAAIFTAAVSISKITTKLLKPMCLECGRELSGEPIGAAGIICPDCGGIHMPRLADMRRSPTEQPATADGQERA